MTAEWEADEWLIQLARQHWTMVVCGDRRGPDALVAVSRGKWWADVVVLRAVDEVAAYRTLIGPSDDPLCVGWVVWHYLGVASWTIRAALSIPDGVLDQQPYPIPHACQVPEAQRRPLTIRLGAQRPIPWSWPRRPPALDLTRLDGRIREHLAPWTP